MSVDLTFLPLISDNYWASHTHLEVYRRSSLWPSVENLPSKELPEPLYSFRSRGTDGEYCYGKTTEDPYGNNLRWVTVEDLLTLSEDDGVRDNYWNRAVWAYLAEMPKHWPIVLYWH